MMEMVRAARPKQVLMPLLATVGLWILGFSAWAQPKSVPIDKVILKADNYILLRSEFEVGVLQALQSGQKEDEKLRCKVLNQLALAKLMLAKSDIDSITVKEADVDLELDQRMDYMLSAVGGREKLEKTYNKTVDQFKVELRAQVEEQLVVRKVQASITEDVKVTPAQVKRYFGVIPKDSLPYMSTQVEVSQIVHLFKAGRNRKLLSRTKAQELREQILKGDDFDLMAKLYSQDPGSATQGGKILGIMRGQMVPEFEAAAMSGKKGEISPVIESAYGYHIIELLDKRGNEYDARHILIRPEADIEDQKNSFAFLDSLREAIVKDSITFEKAANKYSDDTNTKANGGYITDAGTGSTRIPTEDLDPKLFFTIDTMKVGTVSKPIPFVGEDGKGGFRILYYKSKLVPHEANLKDDYQKIQNSALGDKRTKAMKAWVRKAKNEVAITVDPEYADCKLLDEEAGI